MRTIAPSRSGAASGKSANAIGNEPRSASSAAGFVGVNATRCSASLKMRNTAVENPPMSRLELVAIASNTGCTSDGDAAMTFRISAVPVWRSSASRVSLNSRTLWIAITAWSTKARSSAISLALNSPGP